MSSSKRYTKCISSANLCKVPKRQHREIKYEFSDTGNNAKNSKPNAPADWELIYENIKKMRSNRDAPVDMMGAHKCADKEENPSVFRFQTLVSLMLSSQTKDNITYAAMQKLRDHGLDVENILKTSQETLQKLIYPVGFYKRKSEYIYETCKILKEKYNNDIPGTIDELCELPGVGKKMAYICMDIAWDKIEGIGVDTHVHRICNRLGWTKKTTKTPEDTRKQLEEWLPKEYWKDINLLLVGFGQQICLPTKPKCSECLNKKICPFGIKSYPADDDSHSNIKQKKK